MEVFKAYLETLGGITFGGLVLILILISIPIVWIVYKKMSHKAKIQEHREIIEAKTKYEEAKRGEKLSEEKAQKFGVGSFKCMAFRPGNIIDWTTIPAPIGELYQADASCPVSGGVYIVRETEDGDIIDYDPREVKVDIKTSPERAWYATHWDIVKRVYSIPLAWWRSTATWFAAGMMLILFITVMAAIGG